MQQHRLVLKIKHCSFVNPPSASPRLSLKLDYSVDEIEIDLKRHKNTLYRHIKICFIRAYLKVFSTPLGLSQEPLSK